MPERAPCGAPGSVPVPGRVAAALCDHVAHGARLARALGRHLPPVPRQAPAHQSALTPRAPLRPPRRAPLQPPAHLRAACDPTRRTARPPGADAGTFGPFR